MSRKQVDARPSVIRTTDGDIDPESLGKTSIHEHIRVDLGPAWYSLRSPDSVQFRDTKVAIETLGDVRWNAATVLDNMTLDDDKLMTAELRRWRAAGGDAVVDLTSAGLKGDPEAVARIASLAGVRVVLGFGHYIHSAHSQEHCLASVDELAEMLDQEARFGIAGTKLLPGTVGEIGMSGPPVECERRALRAAARVAARYNMSLSIHVDNTGDYGMEHVAECMDEGLAPDRVICGHMDERLSIDYHKRVLEAGANLGFDTFGSELYFSGAFHHPSDEQRMVHLADLVHAGYANQVVLGHDVAVKVHLRSFGGNGYDHLLVRIAPELEKRYGIESAALDQMLIDNPRRLLTCSPPGPPSSTNS